MPLRICHPTARFLHECCYSWLKTTKVNLVNARCQAPADTANGMKNRVSAKQRYGIPLFRQANVWKAPLEPEQNSFLGCFGGLQGIFARKFCLPCPACRRPALFGARKPAPAVPDSPRGFGPFLARLKASEHSRALKIPVGKLQNLSRIFTKTLLCAFEFSSRLL